MRAKNNKKRKTKRPKQNNKRNGDFFLGTFINEKDETKGSDLSGYDIWLLLLLHRWYDA